MTRKTDEDRAANYIRVCLCTVISFPLPIYLEVFLKQHFRSRNHAKSTSILPHELSSLVNDRELATHISDDTAVAFSQPNSTKPQRSTAAGTGQFPVITGSYRDISHRDKAFPTSPGWPSQQG